MRVNVYAEEITDDIQAIEQDVNGRTLFGLRFYLKSHPDGTPASSRRRSFGRDILV